MDRIVTVISYTLGTLIGLAIVGVMLAWPVQMLLNRLVPVLIPGAAAWHIGFWEAWGLSALCGLLFKDGSQVKMDTSGPVKRKDPLDDEIQTLVKAHTILEKRRKERGEVDEQ